MTTPEQFDDYIKKLLEAKEQKRHQALSAEERKEIALSIGLSESDWNSLCTQAEQALERGQNHLNHHNYEEALKAFTEAEEFLKDDERTVRGLMLSYDDAFRETGADKYKVKAETKARELLNLHPSDPEAARLLSRLRKHSPKINHTSPKKKSKVKPLLIISALIAFVFFFILTFLVSEEEEVTPVKARTEIESTIQKEEKEKVKNSAERLTKDPKPDKKANSHRQEVKKPLKNLNSKRQGE